MSAVYLLEQFDYDQDNYSQWTPDFEQAYATADVAQAEANRRNYEVTRRWIAKYIAEHNRRVRLWAGQRREHDALYAAGLREAPFNKERPTWTAISHAPTVDLWSVSEPIKVIE